MSDPLPPQPAGTGLTSRRIRNWHCGSSKLRSQPRARPERPRSGPAGSSEDRGPPPRLPPSAIQRRERRGTFRQGSGRTSGARSAGFQVGSSPFLHPLPPPTSEIGARLSPLPPHVLPAPLEADSGSPGVQHHPPPFIYAQHMHWTGNFFKASRKKRRRKNLKGVWTAIAWELSCGGSGGFIPDLVTLVLPSLRTDVLSPACLILHL